MSIFCEPLYKSLQQIERDGIVLKINGDKVKIHAFLICLTADLPAKSSFMNMIQFNGKYGCNRCLCRVVALDLINLMHITYVIYFLIYRAIKKILY